jgi:bisanhydrobacterioruberin hydratase
MLYSLWMVMLRLFFQRLALALFLLYLALFPGSTIIVAIGQVPAWGIWMGGALLLLQGVIVLCWLLGSYGRRGALAAALVLVLGWGVEQLGVGTGFPFGRYRYTDTLQPLIVGDVPLAIPCAWLMVVLGAHHIRFWILDFRLYAPIQNLKSKIPNALLTATLILLLDLQIETVATGVNHYWIWLDSGPYYGVPTANFIAWWLVGLAMAIVLESILRPTQVQRTKNKEQTTTPRTSRFTFYVLRFMYHVSRIVPSIPTALYLLNTLMFTAINLAHGYPIAGLIGVGVLLATILAGAPSLTRDASRRRDDPPGHLYIDAAAVADEDTSLRRR